MTDALKTQVSLIQQIFDEMFLELMGNGEFDPELIENLRLLSAKGEFNKHQNVAKAIKSTSKDYNETTRT